MRFLIIFKKIFTIYVKRFCIRKENVKGRTAKSRPTHFLIKIERYFNGLDIRFAANVL